MQGQWYLNWVSLLLILMIILKSLLVFFCFFSAVACVRVREKEKRKLENLKIKRNSICRRLRIAKEKKKNRVLSSNSFNINVPQCNLIFIRNRSQRSTDIELIYHMTFFWHSNGLPNAIFSSSGFAKLDICEKNVIFSFRPLFPLEACFNVGRNHIFSRVYTTGKRTLISPTDKTW